MRHACPWFLVLTCVVGVGFGQGSWTPTFELHSHVNSVTVGSSFSVDIFVGGVAGDVAGYQAEIAFDPAQVQAVDIVQGPYLPFTTFFGVPGAFPNVVRVGGLNIPVPLPIPPGPGGGVIATVTFQTLVPGPIHLDLTPFCVLSGPGGVSIAGNRRDGLVQARAPGDTLAISGVPNRGGTLNLEIIAPGLALVPAVTAGSFGNGGIPIAGHGIVPLDFDGLVALALQNAPPYTNSTPTLDGSGYALTQVAIPDVPGLVGLRIWFASVVLGGSTGVVISNSTHCDIIDP